MSSNSETPTTINCIVPVALKETIAALRPEFETQSGHTLNLTHRLNPEVPGLIDEGVTWDLAMTNPRYINQIITSGHSDAASHKLFGYSPLAFAKRGHSNTSLLTTNEKIAAMLIDANSIAITDAGTSGEMFRKLAGTLDVWQAVKSAIRPMRGGGPITSLLNGDVEIAMVPLSNVVTVGNITPIAICPDDLGVHIDLSICLYRQCTQGAREFSEWLLSADRDRTLSKLGVYRQPPHDDRMGSY
ncbi:MAG: substrate-binding domain-containing protein [Pseudomonadota bacterium]